MIDPISYHAISGPLGRCAGYRWTHEYQDSEGIYRKLVVHVAIGGAGYGGQQLPADTACARLRRLAHHYGKYMPTRRQTAHSLMCCSVSHLRISTLRRFGSRMIPFSLSFEKTREMVSIVRPR